MATQYRVLETMILGKIVRLERHILELEDEKVAVEAKFKALSLLKPCPHGHYTNKPIFGNLRFGFNVPWPKRHPQVCVHTPPPRPIEENCTAAMKEMEDQIAGRKKEIEVIKDVFNKAKELPEERCNKALLSFIDLYKDCKEPEMACEIKPVVCAESVAMHP